MKKLSPFSVALLGLCCLTYASVAQVKITHVSPTSGIPSALVRIHGTGFTSSSIVQFSGIPATNVTYLTSNLLIAAVPAGVSPGWGSVVVQQGDLSSNSRDFSILLPTAANLVFAEQTPSRLPILMGQNLGLGDFTFADFTGDKAPEMVIALGPKDVFLKNDGTGIYADETSMRLPSTFGSGASTLSCDVDMDGDPDLVHITYSIGLQLFQNNGSGMFADASMNVPPALGGRHYACGDVDNDGDIDLVSARGNLLINDGSGVFTEESGGRGVSAVRATSVDLGDFDNDGDLDIAYGGVSTTTVLLFTNDGTGVFTDETSSRIPTAPESSNRIMFADVDSDLDLDIFAPCYGGGYDQVFINDGTGHFTNETETRIPYRNDPIQAGALGDVDGDGDLDFVVCGRSIPLQLYVNDGNGFFTRAGAGVIPSLALDYRWVELADIDGNGHLDLGATSAGDAVRLFVGTSDNANRPPVLSLPSRYILERPGDNIQFDLAATDPDHDRISFHAFNLPSGASLNTHTGKFRWNTSPKTQGVFDFFAYVSDSKMGAEMRQLSLTVDNGIQDCNNVQLLETDRGIVGCRPDGVGLLGQFPNREPDTYVYGGGPWVGGIVDGQIIVAHTMYTSEFVPSEIGSSGQPFHVFNSSNCEDKKHWPPEFCSPGGRPIIVPGAQNLVVEYNDVHGTQQYNMKIPLGIEIRQRSLAFDKQKLDNAVIFIWEIKNISDQTIQDAYFGYWGDFDIGAADDRGALVNDMGIIWDQDFAELDFHHQPAIVGFDILQSPVPQRLTSYTTFTAYQPVPDPTNDLAQYNYLSGQWRQETNFAGDCRILPSTGPFTLGPGESVVIAGALLFVPAPEGTTSLNVDPITFRPSPDDPVLAELLHTQADVREYYDAHLRGSNLAKMSEGAADDQADQESQPTTFRLDQNWPNPFNPKTVVSGQWTVDSKVRLVVYDVLGREVAVLADGRYPAGRYEFTFDGNRLASGVYFYRLTAGDCSATKAMILQR